MEQPKCSRPLAFQHEVIEYAKKKAVTEVYKNAFQSMDHSTIRESGSSLLRCPISFSLPSHDLGRLTALYSRG